MTTTTKTPLEEWAHKAAQELASHTTLVDWRANSKRLSEQIEGFAKWIETQTEKL